MRSAVNLEAIAQLDGPVALAVAVDGIGEGVPALGQQALAAFAAARVSVSSISASKAPVVLARPKRSKSSTRRRSPSRIAAMEARVSPLTISGKRELR